MQLLVKHRIKPRDLPEPIHDAEHAVTPERWEAELSFADGLQVCGYRCKLDRQLLRNLRGHHH